MKNKAKKIAFLGPEFSFSHIGARKYFAKLKTSENYEFSSCRSLIEVVNKVDSGVAEYGFIPFWNTSKYYIHIAQEQIINSRNIGIVDNFKMKINLYLLSKGDNINKIKVIYTIKHVFAQCEEWLSKRLQHIKLKEVASTTLGIRKALLKEYYGAIGAHEAAKHYGLNIIAGNIQNKKNETLFFVIKRKPSYERKICNFTLLAYPLVDFYKTRSEIKPLMMSHLLYPTQEWPISLESRDEKWNFLEVPGHLEDINVRSFITTLKKQLRDSRVLGCYDTSITNRINSVYSFDSN